MSKKSAMKKLALYARVAGGMAIHRTSAWSPAAARSSAARMEAREVLSSVQSRQGGAETKVSRVVILREASERPMPLEREVRACANGTLVISSALAWPERAQVVDEFLHRDGRLVLHEQDVDFMRYLRMRGVEVKMEAPERVSMSEVLGESQELSNEARQSTNQVLMVAPTAFGFNAEAAADNAFMHEVEDKEGCRDVRSRAIQEHAGLVHVLREQAGIRVRLLSHTEAHNTPDAVFPNNWFSTHSAEECGARTLVTYSMKAPSRQRERRIDAMHLLQEDLDVERHVDMTQDENLKPPRMLEGTGSLVLDRVHGVAYVALSERSHVDAAEKWCDALGYKELVTFHSTDALGRPIYHTNVIMAIGTGVAIICSESIADPKERQHLLAMLSKTHEIVDITRDQVDAFCGNVIEVQDHRRLPCLALSTGAMNAFTPDQIKVMKRHLGAFYHAPFDTIEQVGGGGVRCAIAEIF